MYNQGPVTDMDNGRDREWDAEDAPRGLKWS
ncbi:hypothetical protein C770_GR4pC0223 (plasmid) [Sinorhizobium meliloti GR4]|nr:hypothetical protein C770_GR4pC0223 [Sinorhizobium meliloti GR4]